MCRSNLFAVTVLLILSATGALAQSKTSAKLPQVTLYSPLKNLNQAPKAFFDFRTQAITGPREHWDLVYGSLYAGADRDWFRISTRPDDRTAIQDLGALDWSDSFKVPVVEPLPALKEGEHRRLTVNASGRNGADGANGVPGRSGFSDKAPASVINAQPVVRNAPTLDSLGSTSEPVIETWPAPEAPPKKHSTSSAKPARVSVDPFTTKAVAGHIYVIHVVDSTNDFYALFRVDALERGDNCTISWRLIPAPAPKATHSQ